MVLSVEVIVLTFTVEYEREDDGRWLAEVLELPGVLAYGNNSDDAIAKAQALALRVLADGDVEQLWITESQRRYEAYLKGELNSVPGEEAMARVRRRLNDRS